MLPFPTPISVGTDICQIARIRRIITGPTGIRFLQRVFTPNEQQIFSRRLSPAFLAAEESLKARAAALSAADRARQVAEGRAHEIPSPERRFRNMELEEATTFIAGRFAAKEAVFKAHPGFHLAFHDVEILARKIDPPPGENKSKGAAPFAVVKTSNAGLWAHAKQEAQISISHDGGYATAVCIGFRAPESRRKVVRDYEKKGEETEETPKEIEVKTEEAEVKEEVEPEVKTEEVEVKVEEPKFKVEETGVKVEKAEAKVEKPEVNLEEVEVIVEEAEVKTEEPEVKEPEVKEEEAPVKTEVVEAEEPKVETEETKVKTEMVEAKANVETDTPKKPTI